MVQCPSITKLDSDVITLGGQTDGFTPQAWTVVMTGLIGYSCGPSVSQHKCVISGSISKSVRWVSDDSKYTSPDGSEQTQNSHMV